jgi:Uma2 family endonuclease
LPFFFDVVTVPAMIALESPDFIRIEDYLAGEEISGVKHEYMGGTVHVMAGATNQHNANAGNCVAALHGNLRGKSCQPFNRDTKVRLEFPDHTRFYDPDAMVACEPNPPSDHFQDHPDRRIHHPPRPCPIHA